VLDGRFSKHPEVPFEVDDAVGVREGLEVRDRPVTAEVAYERVRAVESGDQQYFPPPVGPLDRPGSSMSRGFG
jgi:hypothetical protein